MSEFKKLKTEEEKAQPEEIINVFGREAIIVDCKFCEKRVLTETETETTWTGILLSIVLLLMFKLIAIPLIIVLIPLTQQTIHRCPSCLNKIGTCNFYDYLSLSDKLITLKLGSIAVILSRKLLLGFFICLLLTTICFYYFSNVIVEDVQLIEDTWSDYYKFCSPKEFQQHSHQAKVYCQKYKYSNVAWDGYVVRVDYDNSFITKHKVSMLVKMEVNNNSHEGDLYLKIDEYKYNRMKDVIYNISRGDHIYFNATITHEGSDRSPLLAEPFDLIKKESDIKIDPHIHHHGRYSMDGNKNNEVHKDLKKNDKVYEELKEFVADTNVDTKKQKESYH